MDTKIAQDLGQNWKGETIGTGKWSSWRRVATVHGPTKTVTGETVNVPVPISAWEHVKGAPWFNTEAEAIAYFGILAS